jgi:hypothetical protein
MGSDIKSAQSPRRLSFDVESSQQGLQPQVSSIAVLNKNEENRTKTGCVSPLQGKKPVKNEEKTKMELGTKKICH